jgi:hypothetical protein
MQLYRSNIPYVMLPLNEKASVGDEIIFGKHLTKSVDALLMPHS